MLQRVQHIDEIAKRKAAIARIAVGACAVLAADNMRPVDLRRRVIAALPVNRKTIEPVFERHLFVPCCFIEISADQEASSGPDSLGKILYIFQVVILSRNALSGGGG